MDHSPIDIDLIARLANDLFRDGAPVAPGPTEIPSAAQASAPAFGPNAPEGMAPVAPVSVAPVSVAPVSVAPTSVAPTSLAPMSAAPAAGGASFSPSSPPTSPAYGRAVSPEVPIMGFGIGQPRFEASPDPSVPPGFDPRATFDPKALPGFGPIPHIEDGFDVSALGVLDPGASPSSFLAPAQVPGLAAAPFSAAPGPSHLPSVAETGMPAFGGPFSPSAAADRSGFGRPVSAGPQMGGYGLPNFDAARGQDKGVLHALDPRHLQVLTALDVPKGLDASAFQSFLAPTNVPGLAAPRPASPGVGTLPATSARSIDRPTPNAFQFTDAPHLGDFAEESILRESLDPRHGAPAVEGLPDQSKPLPDPRAGLVPSPSPSFYFLNDGMDYFANDVPKLARPSAIPFNAEAVRTDFPILQQRVNGFPLIWLDNGATTQKPQAVIDRISSFYENENSNINRSAHELAARATDAYEDARKTVQRFINAPTVEELVFLRGTTEGINLVAQSFGRRFIKQGDEIVLTQAEHHANIVPWYLLAKDVGATLRIVPFDDHGEILLDEYEKLLNDRVKIVAMTHVSNALGTVLPAKAMTEMAHRHGIPVLVDGAQSISHMPIDVQDIDCDFFVFSGHKVFGPTGIGVVYGKKALLDQMPPWQGGGNMIKDVTFEKITFQPAPGRFEAGTGNIADAVGLGEAFKYLERLGMTNIAQHEHALLDYATQRLASVKGLTIIGTAKEKAGVISFLLAGKDPVEVGKALNQKGIAVRAGHHCALPILRRYGVEATVRPAFAMYNTFDDADRLADAVREIAAG